MSDVPSVVTSSVAPRDSISSRGGKKQKPGKYERAQKRAERGGNPALPASAAKAAVFAASGSSEPVPTPGRYPVVFPTGAGEPSRESQFVYDHETIATLATAFPARYVQHPRYAEFKVHSGVNNEGFAKFSAVSFLLGLAQQTVHAHVNMGLPQLDFAAVASSDVFLTAAQRAAVTQFGEFSEPMLGTRFVLADYVNTVSRLIFSAEKVMNNGNAYKVIERSWLPMSASDRVTKVTIGDALSVLLRGHDLSVSPSVLTEGVLSGEVPPAWEAIKPILGDVPPAGEVDTRDRFDFLFKAYRDEAVFTTAFSTESASSVLEELDLEWEEPSAGHLNWQFNAKSVFSELADRWSRLSASYRQFFSMGSGSSNKTSASGSAAQMAMVSVTDEVTVVKTHVGLSAAQFSLVACFPAECIFAEPLTRNVVVTTPLNVAQRATEFCQTDWV